MKNKKNKTSVRKTQSEESKNAILETALRLFSEHGYDGVGLRAIADEVGVNHAMIGYYFGGKKELWQAATQFLFERQAKIYAESKAKLSDLNLTPKEQAKADVRGYVKYCAKYPEHARLMIQESMRDTDRLTTITSFLSEQHKSSIATIDEWMNEGFIPRMPPVSLIYALVGMSQLPFALKNEIMGVHDIDYTDEQVIEAHCDTVVSLFFTD